MAFLEYKNVKIAGLSSCVPKQTEEIVNYSLFTAEEAEKFTASTGVEQRRFAEEGVTASDLCYEAAKKLLADLKWQSEDIDVLIYVSQTRDYILPSTSCILQDRLGISTNCYAMDIPYGCSGYIYGLSTVASLLSNGELKKALLLVGDAVHVHHNYEDITSYPLFGDAGTATALEFEEGNNGFKFHFGTDGSGYKAIIIPEGGYRHRFTKDSIIVKYYENEGGRNGLDCYLNGMDVFAFGISRPPQSVKALCEHFALDLGTIDYFVMHQANKFLNEKIRKKLKIPEEKTPYSLKDFGNTSCASIPLSICLSIRPTAQKQKIISCGFGVGLSWGSVYFELDENVIICDLVEI